MLNVNKFMIDVDKALNTRTKRIMAKGILLSITSTSLILFASVMFIEFKEENNEQ